MKIHEEILSYCKLLSRLLLYEWIQFYSNSIKQYQFLYKKQKEYIFWWSHTILTFRTPKLVKFNQITPVFVQKPKKWWVLQNQFFCIDISDEFKLKFPELSRAELGHLNFWAETELTLCTVVPRSYATPS